jgi:hypothetical protein
VAWLALSAPSAHADSLRFYGNNGGNGGNFIDRVEIPVDNPATPADIGATDFTIELWLKTTPGNNAPAITPGSVNNWIEGNIFFDRDRFGAGRAFGASLTGGGVTFGVVVPVGAAQEPRTWRAATDIRDGNWHHVAIQRTRNSGTVQIYIDGVRRVDESGPAGDISFPDGAGGGSGPGGKDPFIVLGAEKHDADPRQFPSYFGYMTELRLSNMLRYSGANITVPSGRFAVDGNTLALYHFGDAPGNVLVDADGGQSNGNLRRGGTNNGPTWEADSPFAASPGTLQFSQSQFSVTEGTANASISVNRSGGTLGAASVTVSITSGTATQGADYNVPANTTLSWGGGVGGPQPLNIPVVNDSNPESAETVNLALTGASGATVGVPATATLTITDDDSAPSPGSLQFSAAAFTTSEGGGNVSLNVTRTGGSAGAVGIDYTTNNGTASAGSDYTARSGTLNFAAGDTSETISVPITDDTAVETGETFTVTLSNPAGGATLGLPATATVTINDNDTAPQPPPSTSSGGGGGASDLWTFLAGAWLLWLGRTRRTVERQAS